mmetsp:Transcript_23039/g.54431  ORF Transcript_23039/g.54431 Transcript_23039/m.54431 type:complete len:602 (+) Transcript_23039:70-1875(+)|eukprot:CAMPEP_0197187542 /NCGR_PEP_ID=MMETSP1423-20130617/16055_1 /TAXON_ID=476441 /ORGANISM="Pseudo-nitzschia heimii, Strain UNC1101" /LENGTH=601 /DNA_ID=CAMNT_0042639145 /DNA_START=92 /DNA_END=1897 /DNA_ORIENTATION=-
MAAPPSKQSPSNQKMQDSESAGNNARLKDPPPSSPPAAASSVSPSAAAGDGAAKKATPRKADPLTYRASETSESYFVAKQLLNSDDFEGALNVIEDALHMTTKEIRGSLGLTDTDDNTDIGSDLETEIQMHEALGPLHYLYGTTLLYSLEEAKDDGNDNGAMMMTAEGAHASTTVTATPDTAIPAAGAAAAPVAPDSDNPWAHLGASATDKDSPSNAVAAEADLEDIHIAWENLEAARAIVEKILLRATTATGGDVLSEHYVAKLQLDLAQIHLREGDLQRINGNYTSAVGDYSTCLQTLLRHNNTRDEDNNVRDLDRKIADTQYNLGLTYLTSSSDLQKEVAGADNTNTDATTNPKEKEEAAQHRRKATILATEHCRKGIQQHFDCARTFCKILAKLCGVDPDTILSPASESGTHDDATGDAKKPPAGPKTTGLEDEGDGRTAAAGAHTEASKTLSAWRTTVAALVLSRKPGDSALNILQVLDEIQETIDEAERSQEAVFQAATIRVRAQRAAAGEETVDNPDGSTTTIGFGPGASSVTASATAVSGSAEPAIADAKPVMMVKKKKKRKTAESSSARDDGRESEKASEDGEAAKRAKTEP